MGREKAVLLINSRMERTNFMESEKNKARKYKRKSLIKIPFQLHWIGVAFIFAFVLLSIFILLFVTHFLITTNMGFFESLSRYYDTFLIIVVAWLIYLVMLLAAVRSSLQTAGPEYRFRRYIDSIAKGDFDQPQVVLRKRDELKDLAADFNEMMKYLKKRRIESLKAVRTIEMNIERLEISEKDDKNGEPSREECIKIIKEACLKLYEIQCSSSNSDDDAAKNK
jgi:HAMP domain-containing protein